MAKQITSVEWDRLKKSVDNHDAHMRGQKQALFRLFQAIKARQDKIAEDILEKGVALDVPLILEESQGGVPKCESFQMPRTSLKNVTILGWASANGRLDQVDWLVKKGASVSAPFGGGRDSAWVAMESREFKVFSRLLALGAPPNFRINQDRHVTRLMCATYLSELDMVKVLLNKKARVNDCDKTGRTALHYNFERNPYGVDDVEIGTLLIDWGGNANAEDLDGVPAHALAQSVEQSAVLHKFEATQDLSAVSPSVTEIIQQRELDGAMSEADPIINLDPADPGLPQLKNPPILKTPRF